jgi:predicted AlkP superfamily pyrophosphatase or phosphodiesterase
MHYDLAICLELETKMSSSRVLSGTLMVAALQLLSPAPAKAADTLTKPKLIIAISVDQFSADLFAEYRGAFTGGFKRLQAGVVFPSGYQSHAATETCPGHSTILTGTHPARNGIIANNWENPARPRIGKNGLPDYDVYCAEDESVAGSSASNYTVSPVHLKAMTLGDRLKAQNPASRVVSVAGKDRAAVMMGGHAMDEAWWWSGDRFMSFANRAAPAPKAVAAVNVRARLAIARPPKPVLPAQCAGHASPVPIGDGNTVGTLAQRRPDDARGFRASAELDQLTLDLAQSILTDLKLGKGASVDVLSVGLSATDYIGHTFGTGGAEMCAQMVALDAMLGRFLNTVDASGAPYVVVLTADHGGHDLPERNNMLALPGAQRVDALLIASVLGSKLAQEMGLDKSVLLSDSTFGDVYLAPTVPADKRDAVLAAALAAYAQAPQVAVALDGAQLAKLPVPTGPAENWTLTERARASYYAGRSGDIIVLLKPRVTPIPSAGSGYVATHGSPWDYDRRVPILFWQRGIQGFEQPNAVETVDILPTLAALISLPIAKGDIDGRCLDVRAGERDSCAGQ